MQQPVLRNTATNRMPESRRASQDPAGLRTVEEVAHATICLEYGDDGQPTRVESTFWMAVRVFALPFASDPFDAKHYDWEPHDDILWLRNDPGEGAGPGGGYGGSDAARTEAARGGLDGRS